MRTPDALRRLDDRVLGQHWHIVQSERRARRIGNCFVALALVLVIINHYTDGSFVGGAVLFALAGGACLGRAAEARAGRQGNGLTSD